MMDHVAPEDHLAGRLEHADLTRCADGAEWTRWEIHLAARITTLQAQLVLFRAVPEMLCFGRGLRQGAAGFSHLVVLSIRNSAWHAAAGDVGRAVGAGDLGVAVAVGDLERFAGAVGVTPTVTGERHFAGDD